MAKHLNRQIADVGRDTFVNWTLATPYSFMPANKGELDIVIVPVDTENRPYHEPSERDIDNGYLEEEFKDKTCALVITTKKFELKQGEKVTGLDVAKVQSLQAKAKDAGLEDVFFVVVDARLKICMGGFLSELMKPREQFGMQWPMLERTRVGEIYFFHVLQIPTLFRLSEEVVNEIGHLAAQNRADKNQGYLFL